MYLSYLWQRWRIADKGWDPAYGARPLKRAIQKYVQDPLAEMLLAGDVQDSSTVKISAGKGGLTFNGNKPPAVDEDEDELESV